MGKTVAMAFELSACLLLLFSIGGATVLSSSGNSLEDGLPQPQALMVPLTIISSDIASPKGAGKFIHSLCTVLLIFDYLLRFFFEFCVYACR